MRLLFKSIIYNFLGKIGVEMQDVEKVKPITNYSVSYSYFKKRVKIWSSHNAK